MKEIIKVPSKSYNDFCMKLYRMMIDTTIIKSSESRQRYKFYDKNGNVTAFYDERKDYGIVYNYNTKNDLINKVLTFC